MKSDGSTGHGAEAVQTYHRALTFTRERNGWKRAGDREGVAAGSRRRAPKQSDWRLIAKSFSVMAGLVWGFLSSWNFAFFRPPRCLARGWRKGRLPALRFLGSATCRWLDPCQGRSRRRRGPKASLYKGPAIDDHRRPRSPGRVHVARSASLADETAVLHS